MAKLSWGISYTLGTGATLDTGSTLSRGAAVGTAVVVTGIIALVIGVLTVIVFYCIINHRSRSCKPKSSSHQQQYAVPSCKALQEIGSVYEEVTELRPDKAYGPIQTGFKVKANEAYGLVQKIELRENEAYGPLLASCQEQQTGAEYDEVQVPATSGKRKIELRANEAYGPVQKIELRENKAYEPVEKIELRENEAYGPVLASCQEQRTGAEYDEVQVPANSGKHKIELRANEAYEPMRKIELRENEAYGPMLASCREQQTGAEYEEVEVPANSGKRKIELRENKAYEPVCKIELRENEAYRPMLASCQEQQTGPEYDEVQLPSTSGKHKIELRANEAYGPVQH